MSGKYHYNSPKSAVNAALSHKRQKNRYGVPSFPCSYIIFVEKCKYASDGHKKKVQLITDVRKLLSKRSRPTLKALLIKLSAKSLALGLALREDLRQKQTNIESNSLWKGSQ